MYLQRLREKYDIKELPSLGESQRQSVLAKAGLRKLLGLSDFGRAPIASTEKFAGQFARDVFIALSKIIPASRSAELDYLLGITTSTTNEVNLINNRCADGSKLSKALCKAMKRSGVNWDSLDYSTLRALLPNLPEENEAVTPEVIVQNIFNATANMQADIVFSTHFDDFANCAESSAFAACYKVGGQMERAPFSLALSPNVAVVLIYKKGTDKLIGRSWLAISDDANTFAMFGVYGVRESTILDYLSDQVRNRMSPTAKWRSIAPCPKIKTKGEEYERHAMYYDPVVRASTLSADSPTEVEVQVPHFNCPVCGNAGPESRGQIICGECAGENANSILMPRSFRVADYSALLFDSVKAA